jgi:hypothetical protein
VDRQEPVSTETQAYTLILDCLTESIVMTGLDADKFDALEIRPFLGFRLDEVVCYGKRLEADEA